MLGAFEDHVLYEVRDTVPLAVFVSRAGLHPNADRDGAYMLHLFGDEGQPIGHHRASNAAIFLHHPIFTHLRRSQSKPRKSRIFRNLPGLTTVRYGWPQLKWQVARLRQSFQGFGCYETAGAENSFRP